MNSNKKLDNANSGKYMSNTEYRIAKYLDSLNIPYKMQYTFRGCKDKQLLPFDFAIIQNNKVVLIIEYDGEQHFHPVSFHGESKTRAKYNFKKCKKHDRIKNRYCKLHRIPLLRISYKENKDLYKIIKRELYNKKILS